MRHPWQMAPLGGAAQIARKISRQLPELRTARLLLRAPRINDFDAYSRIVTSDRGRYIGGPLTQEEAWLDFNQLTAGWLLRGAGLWTVERNDGGAPIGFVLLAHEFGDPEAELGFLFLPEGEGRGYAAEATRAARDVAFELLGWQTVVSYIDPANSRAIRLAETLGAVSDDAARMMLPEIDRCLVYRHVQPKGEAS